MLSINIFKRYLWCLRLWAKPKIFVISFQRTGTTSTGIFFKDHGFRVATYWISKSNSWTREWLNGNYKAIFKSLDFRSNQVFEDDPWWCADFYRVLFNRFPRAKFILLERDPDKWFDSMLNHSNGKSLGNTYIHAKLYSRLQEYTADYDTGKDSVQLSKDGLMLLDETHRAHYKDIYQLRNQEVLKFFNQFGPSRLFHCNLESKNKWVEMGKFIGFQVKSNYDVHFNKSKI